MQIPNRKNSFSLVFSYVLPFSAVVFIDWFLLILKSEIEIPSKTSPVQSKLSGISNLNCQMFTLSSAQPLHLPWSFQPSPLLGPIVHFS